MIAGRSSELFFRSKNSIFQKNDTQSNFMTFACVEVAEGSFTDLIDMKKSRDTSTCPAVQIVLPAVHSSLYQLRRRADVGFFERNITRDG